MASDISQGDVELPYLDVAPADSGTAATLTVYRPDGTSTTITASGGDLVAIPGTTPTEYQQRWTADTPVVYDQPNKWVLHWDVTGTGEGAEDLEVYVVPSPTAGGPTWLPGRSRVAVYVPKRTLVRSAASTISSQDSYLMSWDSSTVPTGSQVDRIIADGASWVTARVSPMNSASFDLASTCVALFSAAMIERSWPEDEQSLQRANDLERRLDALMADLIKANNSSNGTDDFGLEISPVWTFPNPDLRWDYPTYF